MSNTKIILPSGDTRILARAKAFTCESMREYCFNVSPNGEVTVFDSVAGHYTSRHRLSKRSQSRIRKISK